MQGPRSLKTWLRENSKIFSKKKCGIIYREHSLLVLVVSGPNKKSHFHINPSDEFLFQVKGKMVLHVWKQGRIKRIPIREGESFLIPAGLPHYPERPDRSLGIVVERTRSPGEREAFVWFCRCCQQRILRVTVKGEDAGRGLLKAEAQVKRLFPKHLCKLCSRVKGKSVRLS
jgi:3-hydroxyanthranilate 3,4-dioxygenase